MLDFKRHISASDYRHEAASQCKKFTGDLMVLLVVEFVIGALVSVITNITGVGLLSLFVIPHISFGIIYAMNKVYNYRKPLVEDLFNGFKENYGKKLGIYLLTEVYIMLWSLLFVIPGFVKMYSYAMAPYIHIDRPELSAKECITESRKMMDGNKWELFYLDLSYIGWAMLCVLTFGILSLWVVPRMNYARYLFYLKVSGKGASKDVEIFEEKEPKEEVKSSMSNDDFFADIDSKFN